MNHQCDVCGDEAAFRIQFRENPRSEYRYCRGHARPFLGDGFRPEVSRVRYAR